MTSARKSGNGEVPDTYFRTELKVSEDAEIQAKVIRLVNCL